MQVGAFISNDTSRGPRRSLKVLDISECTNLFKPRRLGIMTQSNIGDCSSSVRCWLREVGPRREVKKRGIRGFPSRSELRCHSTFHPMLYADLSKSKQV